MAKRGRKKKDSPEGMLLEMLEITDREGNVVGLLPRGQIHEQKLFHKAVHVFLFDPEGRIYLQKRSRLKDENPGKWDSSASGHVSPGEPYPVAARRELKEELDIVVTPIQELLVLDHQYPDKKVRLHFILAETHQSPKPVDCQDTRIFSPEEVEKLTLAPADKRAWNLLKKMPPIAGGHP